MTLTNIKHTQIYDQYYRHSHHWEIKPINVGSPSGKMGCNFRYTSPCTCDPWVNYTHDSWYQIRILWKFHVILIQPSVWYLLSNFAKNTTAVPPCHVQIVTTQSPSKNQGSDVIHFHVSTEYWFLSILLVKNRLSELVGLKSFLSHKGHILHPFLTLKHHFEESMAKKDFGSIYIKNLQSL